MATRNIKHIEKLTGIKNGIANLNEILEHSDNVELNKVLFNSFPTFLIMDKLIEIIRIYPDDIRKIVGDDIKGSLDSLESLLSLSNMSKLDTIGFNNCKFTTNNVNFEWSIKSLANLQNLSFFYLNNSSMNVSQLDKLLSSCESLKSISLYSHNFDSQELAQIIDTIGDHCPEVTDLDISGTNVLTEEVLNSLIACDLKLPNLTTIYLPHVTLDTLATFTECFGSKVKVWVDNIIPRPGETEIKAEEIKEFVEYCQGNNYDVAGNALRTGYNEYSKIFTEYLTNKPFINFNEIVKEIDHNEISKKSDNVDLHALYQEYQNSNSDSSFRDWTVNKLDFVDVKEIKAIDVPLTTKMLETLLTWTKSDNLQTVILKNCDNLFTGDHHFDEQLPPPSLGHLSNILFANNKNIHVPHLNQMLASCESLKTIELGNNGFAPKDLASIIKTIAVNCAQLSNLGIYGDDLGKEGVDALVANSSVLKNLEYLYLPEVTIDMLKTITEAFGDGTMIHTFNIIPDDVNMSESEIMQQITEFATFCYENEYNVICGTSYEPNEYSKIFTNYIEELEDQDDIADDSEENEEVEDSDEEGMMEPLEELLEELMDEVDEVIGSPADPSGEQEEVLVEGAEHYDTKDNEMC